MNDIVFFHTMPRSGTQWFATHLGALFEDQAVVTHEPIGYEYRPKEYLRNYDPRALADELAQTQIREHFDNIQAAARDKKYIETGFPSFAALPALAMEFPNRLKVVHLVRNPILNAASLVTHGWYRTRADLDRTVLLTPDDGIVQSEYAEKWHTLSDFEKCLFYWNEVHLHALELRERYPEIPQFLVRFEDIFENDRASAVLKELTSFLGLPWRADLARSVQNVADAHRHSVPRIIEWQKVYEHPRTLELARRFGYDLAATDSTRISSRYQVHDSAFGNVLHRARRKVRRIVGRNLHGKLSACAVMVPHLEDLERLIKM